MQSAADTLANTGCAFVQQILSLYGSLRAIGAAIPVFRSFSLSNVIVGESRIVGNLIHPQGHTFGGISAQWTS
jgi:hypothetical protein